MGSLKKIKTKICKTCQALPKDESPLLSQEIWLKGYCQEFRLRRNFYEIISRYETLFLLCC